MVFIYSEGKFNDNSYLIDGQLFGMKGNLTIYIIENNGIRMMIDTTSPAIMVRRIVAKLKELGIFPIHKLLLSHCHWDHIEGVEKFKKLNKETKVEVLASERAIDNLENPQKMNQEYEVNIKSIENVTPIKEGDIIDINGLELEIFNFFGHSQDCIAILDKKNKNIFSGDAIINRYDPETFIPVFLSHEFNEFKLYKTFEKLRKMKDELNSISLAHFGVWKGEDFDKILNEMEVLHNKTKNSLIQWYKENPSIDYITSNYHENYIPHSTIFTKENLFGLRLTMEWLVEGLKISGFL